MHKLLTKQLAKIGNGAGDIDVAKLIELVSTSYEELDRDRRRTERSIELMVAELEATQNRLLDALDVVPEGFTLFDARDRYVLWNKHYEQMYPESRELLAVGKPFEEVLREGMARGQYPDAIGREEEWLAKRMALHAQPHSSHEQCLPNGRWLRIDERRTADGGTIGVRVDVTEFKRRESELRNMREFLDAVIENVPVTIIAKDARDFRYRLINKAGEDYYGIPRKQILGKTAHDILSVQAADLVEALDRKVWELDGKPLLDEHSIETPGRGMRTATTIRMPMFDEKGQPEYLLVVINDITESKAAEARIAHLAHHDPLTDLPNRTAFNKHLQATLAQAAPTDTPLAVLCVDLDRFKEVNDVFGHAAGDALLCELARRLHRATDGAFLARLGGDEFTVVAVDGDQPAGAIELADRLMATVAEEISVDGHRLRTGISIGIAIHPGDGRDAATLLANADAALYRAKAEGRGSIRFFEAEMDMRIRERRALQHDLHAAIARGEFFLHYQPLAKISGEVLGFEALLRWKHPRQGIISPATFIPAAEESGLIIPIGEWVLREACREAASWPKPLNIAINLSPIQFRHGDLPELVHTVLLETGLKPARLELEITESVLIGDFPRAVSILRRLKALGVRVAMDDFGTGYSSLSYLQSFPFDKIKIDRTFIANLTGNSQSAAIVRAVIGLGRGLELPVVAEGVETADQLSFLVRENCDEVQGFLFGRPHPIAEYDELVGRKSNQSTALALAG